MIERWTEGGRVGERRKVREREGKKEKKMCAYVQMKEDKEGGGEKKAEWEKGKRTRVDTTVATCLSRSLIARFSNCYPLSLYLQEILSAYRLACL